MTGKTLFLAIPVILSLKGYAEARKDFFSSSLRIQELLQTHNQVLPLIQEYASAVKELSTILNRYTSESETGQISGPWESSGDPLKTFLLIRRTTLDLDSIVEATRKMRSLDPLLEIENFRRKEALPDQLDFDGIAKSIIRLQKMYLIPPRDLARGKISEDLESPVKLTASDCLRLGEISEKLTPEKTIFVDAKLWYSAGIGLAANDSEQEGIRKLLEDRLQDVKERGKRFLAMPAEFRDQLNVTINATIDPSTDWGYVQSIGRILCRGTNIRAPSMDAENFCYLRQGPHPYLGVRPLKLEVKSRDPYIVLLHDVVGDREIETLKEQARLKNAPSTHVLANASSGTTDIRVSITSWLPDNHTPGLTKRLEIYLGMKTNVSAWDVEEYQVLNYGIGGHYSLHRDYFENMFSDNQLNKSGNRIATLMFYLNDVEKGGSTIFPYTGISVSPMKGSAVFWWNLRSGGDGDFKTTHAGCPVIYGTKWVANKWFRERGQMFRMPCGPDPKDIVRQL